jgi:hypothetical protein
VVGSGVVQEPGTGGYPGEEVAGAVRLGGELDVLGVVVLFYSGEAVAARSQAFIGR